MVVVSLTGLLLFLSAVLLVYRQMFCAFRADQHGNTIDEKAKEWWICITDFFIVKLLWLIIRALFGWI